MELQPAVPAAQVLSRRQRAVAGLCLVLLALGLALAAEATVVTLLLLAVGFSVAASVHGLVLSYRGRSWTPAQPAGTLGEDELPVYTILVPLMREAGVVRDLLSALDRLDYPREKLDVKLLLEEDDRRTIEAVEAARPAAHVELVVVTPEGPRTKPKACNEGLRRARGELVAIYDAEDRPEREQLRRAAAAFADAPPDVGCYQAKLDFWNPAQNLLTKWFTAEFAWVFDLYRRGLERAGAAITLSGTSNHFPVERLRKLGGWDPFNVTEDADLGIRLARAGYRTKFLDSTTYEEANCRLGNWLRQRSRWSKGFAQTWLVHMRQPLRLWRDLGPRGWLHFQFAVLGYLVVALVNPLYCGLVALWVCTATGLAPEILPPPVLAAAAGALVLQNAVLTGLNVAGLRRRGYRALQRYTLLSPIYLLLIAAAAWRGVLQLFTRPSYWEKTAHGLAGTPARDSA